jgi:hypothetical protein
LTISLPETIGTSHGPSVDGASAVLLTELLSILESELRRQGIPVDDYLRPGAPEADVLAGFEKCGLEAPDEAVAWFDWHDGPVRSPESHKVMPMFMGWSLDETVRGYLNPKGAPKGFEEWHWNPSWIQIMGDANGLAIRCEADRTASPLVRGLTWDGTHGTQGEQSLRQVVSLCTPVTWWIDSLQHGWYRWNAAGNAWENVDHSKQPLIRALHALS